MMVDCDNVLPLNELNVTSFFFPENTENTRKKR